LVADAAASAGDEGGGARAGAGVGAGTGAALGAAEATGGDATGRAAVAGFFFLRTGFFGGATTCRVT